MDETKVGTLMVVGPRSVDRSTVPFDVEGRGTDDREPEGDTDSMSKLGPQSASVHLDHHVGAMMLVP